MTDELDAWLDDAPVVPLGASGDFANWLDDAPVIESGDTGTSPGSHRRRVHMT